jgi:hypothetical protein
MKLNLRDLFWLIFVSAVVTMWWMDRSKLADRLKFYEMPKTIALPQPLATPPLAPAEDPFGFGPADPFGRPASPAPLPMAPAPVSPADLDPFAPAPAPQKPAVDPFG